MAQVPSPPPNKSHQLSNTHSSQAQVTQRATASVFQIIWQRMHMKSLLLVWLKRIGQT